MVKEKMQPLVRNRIWLLPSMLILGFFLPLKVTAKEHYPALDPPFYQGGGCAGSDCC